MGCELGEYCMVHGERSLMKGLFDNIMSKSACCSFTIPSGIQRKLPDPTTETLMRKRFIYADRPILF
jgi:hypothetical protein